MLGELLNEISSMKFIRVVTFVPYIKVVVEIMLCPDICTDSVPNQQYSSKTLPTKM